MRIRGPLKALAAGLLAVAPAGCRGVQGYEGPRRPAPETAELRVNPPEAQMGFLVRSVDGRPVQAQVKLELLPGTHELGLRLTPTALRRYSDMDATRAGAARDYDRRYEKNVHFELTVEPGRTYGLGGRHAAGDYEFWLFDAETGAVLERSSA